MKRKLISLITAFALCLSLCPTWALAAGTLASLSSAGVSKIETLKENRTAVAEFIVEEAQIFDICQWSYTATKTTAIVIKGTGKLYLQGLEGGSVTSAKGIGVKVESGGSLVVEDPVAVTGKTYGLDVASGAAVELSGGTFSGGTAAIRTADGNFAALLVDGHAYFDADGDPMLPADVATAKTVTIKQCADHPGKTYIHNGGAPTHSWACPYCGAKAGAEPCTFSFGADGTAACAGCGHEIAIVIDTANLGDLIYNSQEQTANVTLTVTLGDGTVLTENTDYEVSHTSRADVGEITVTVTGITYNGSFTKTYRVSQAQPTIAWAETAKAVDYNGSPVRPTDLPDVKITAPDDLSSHIQYSYKRDGDTDFTDGLPTNAGTYEIKASLPETQNCKAAETDPCLTLTINKIPAVMTAPAKKDLTYNREPQELVTAGVLEPGAAAEGAKIEFKNGASGTYSTDIPTGTTVSNYDVWYKVEETENYTGKSGQISARINHKTITPTVELSYYTTLYDGGDKEPTVTVKDGEAAVPNTEYAVAYTNNTDVGTATVTVSNKDKGNYIINQVAVNFQITHKIQDALTITDKPNTVVYGDQFTLGTSGGSGNGEVTWKITAGGDVAEVDANSGQVTVKGHGSVTVQATKSGTDPQTNKKNYEDAIATWTFNAVKKPVTATVTADNKIYDGDATATVHAVVEQGVLSGDEITITGLSGTFSDENAGTNKAVTVTGTPDISGDHSEHYDVTLSSRSVKADITKATTNIAVPPGQITPALTYDGTAQALVTAGEANISTIPLEYALSENGLYSTGIPKGTNAGSYEVWYRVPETDNYTGTAADKVPVTIQRKPVADPVVTLIPGSFEYDGAAKEPAVTVKETNDSEIPISPSEYTVAYSDNIDVGTNATVTVTAKADGNYDFSATANFTITKKKATVVTKPSPAGDPLTYNTREQALVTAGTASGGTMVYSVDSVNGTYSPTIPTRSDAGDHTVWYKVEGDPNHSDSDVGSVVVTIAPKVVKDPTIELKNADGTLIRYIYDGAAKTPVPVVKDGSTEIVDTEYDLTYVDNRDAGTATVIITDKAGGNYTVTGSTTFVIDKADIADPAPSAADITYNGKPQELLNGSSFDGGTILYSMSRNGTYTDAIPTATNAGSYTVWYKVTGDKNHNDLAAKSVDDVTIKRKPLTTVTIELSPNAFAYDGQVHMPAVTVKDGNTVLPESEYTVNYPADPKNEGTYTITISDAADGNYDLTGVTTTADFAIGKAPQAELIIDHKTAVTNYGESFTLTTTGGSGGGAVSWEATGSAATVDAVTGEVRITGLGEVTITATKAAEGNYFEAKAYWTFTATPRPVMAAVTVANKVYDGGVSATIDTITVPVLDNDDVAVTGLTAAFVDANVGTGKRVTLDSSEAAVSGRDADKYDVSYPVIVRADITQATTELTAPASRAPLTYSGRPQELVTAAGTNFGDVVYSLDGTDFSTAIPTGTNAGDYTVYYKVVGNANYTGAAGTPIPVAIGPKTITPTVEASPSSCVYDGSKKTPTITVKDGITVLDGDQYTVSWGDTDWTSVGTHTVTITSTGKNYTFTVTGVTAEVEIRKAVQNALKITGKPGAVRYGDTIALDTTGGSGNGSVKWTLTGGTSSTIGETTGVLEIKEMGTFTVTAERAVDNYETATDTWTFTVQPKLVTAEVTVASKVYDGRDTIAADAITARVNARDLVNSDDDVTISGLTGAYDDVNAGTNKTVTLYDTASVDGADAGKYSVSYPATATGTITPKAVTVSVALTDGDLKTDTDGTTKYFEYDGTAKTPAVTVTVTADGSALSSRDYDVSYSDNKNVGTATVTVTAKAGGNYTFDNAQPVTASFVIKKGAAVLTGSPQARSLTYTGGKQELVTVGTATGGAVWYSATGADDSYGPSIPQETDAGTYTVYYMVKGDGNHTDTAPSQVSVTIHPKTVTSPVITLSQTSYVYDGSAKTPTVTEVKDGNTVIPSGEYTPVYSNNTNAGAATVTIQNNNGGNYIVNGTATFTIAKAAASVNEPVGKVGLPYDGTAQELVTAGSSDDGTVVYSLSQAGPYSTAIPTGTAVQTYTVYCKVLGDSDHNDRALAPKTASIVTNAVTTPTIELSSSSFTYDGSEQKPTVTVKDDGGKVIPANEYTVVYGNDGESIIDQGTYTVTITSKGTNYSFAVQTRTVTILPANQTALAITGKPNIVYYGDTLQLGTTGGSGNGTVTWSIGSGSATAGDSLGQFKVTGVGQIKIKASRTAAGSNYADVEDTWEFYAYPKPVTAIVTAKDREYIENDTTAELTVTVPGTAVTVMNLIGTFDSPNVGTNKTVRIDHSDPQVTGNEAGNYEIAYPDTTTASIAPKAATVTGVTKIDDLTYTGSPRALVTPGSATGGSVAYSLDGVNYSLIVPTGTDAGTYKVWYKALAWENYKDSTPETEEVTIGPNTDVPTVMCVPGNVRYDGSEKTPTVIVRDSANANRVIPAKEYTVAYSNNTEVGIATVTVTDNDGGNYEFDTPAIGTFHIVEASQDPMTIVTDKPTDVFYGDSFRLSAAGGSGSGAIQWSIEGTCATINDDGVVTVTGIGGFTVKAQRAADGSYSASNEDAVPFYANPKPVTPIVTAVDKSYDGSKEAQLTATWKTGDLVGEDTIEVHITGEFLTEGVGTNKQVKIIVDSSATGTNVERYVITYPATTTASIEKVNAKLATLPFTNSGLVYDGYEHELFVSGGTTEKDIGVVEYSLSEKGEYSTDIPKATNAGTYTVWYRVADSVNYTGIAPASREVTIQKAATTIDTAPTASAIISGQTLSQSTLNGGVGSVDGSFAWTNGSFKPEVGTSEQEVTFTPADAVNYKTSTISVEVTVAEAPSGDDGPGSIPSITPGSTQTDPDGSTTTKTEDESTGTVTETTEKPDGSSVTKVEQKDGTTATVTTDAGGKTEAEVTLSAQTVSEAQEKGGAVVLPIPEVKTTKSADTAPAVTVNTGSEDAVMVEIPVADVTPGTVAVIVKADGTQEVIKTSVPTENGVAVSLPDGATVKLVDNSKDFADVPAESEEADAVAFTSARELFKGTSETTFDPDVPMTRAMMTTVLARLDGVDTTGGSTWYEKGQEWAVEKGISNGSDPNGSITREQLAVMLWRYAGSPAADGEALDFADADKASEYAIEALRWATAKGILEGTGDGLLDPGGTATRAEAALILKKFIENT